ncbi:MAG: protoheme IX farnesyltransferase [Chloroflexi bacterium]|nr:MAG: protoheme IX farnesyltransferase [Chloroflexota bacterium]
MITRAGRLVIAAKPRIGSDAADGERALRTDLRTLARAYIALTKPGIIWLLLVTTVPAMVMANDGWPGLDTVALVLLGGILTAGGANAINQWYDRDIDAIMARTAKRPIPSGLVPPAAALAWGTALVIAGGIQLTLTVNWLSAVWALAAVGFYVFIYTAWLKRSSVQNIVIGGAAGAVPPLVGWAAVRGSVDVAPVILFLIVFLWTPPHFWALALRYKDEYASVNVPMLPVVRGEAETKKQILIYAVILAAVSLLLPLSGDVSWIYLGAAAVLGIGFIVQAARVYRDDIAPMRLFFFSIFYLPALFLAALIDVFAL